MRILEFYIEACCFPIKTSEEHTFTGQENAQTIALMKANLLMDIYFNN